jgi:hypothetical protein
MSHNEKFKPLTEKHEKTEERQSKFSAQSFQLEKGSEKNRY